MAFSVTMLSWAAIDFKEDFIKLNQMGHVLEAIKWGTDYFIRCHPQQNVLWGQVYMPCNKHTYQVNNGETNVNTHTKMLINCDHGETNVINQVGDGVSDHYCWQRAEDMTTSRTAYKLDAEHPGSDLAGETAAALAATSLAFKPYDSAYSNLLLVHAKQVSQY